MLSLFKRFQKTTTDFSIIKTDMHSHLIPGIDDGAKTLEKSVSYIQGLANLGYKKIITTPHVMGEYYPNTSTIILEGLEEVRLAIQKKNINIELEAAAEYYIDDYFIELLDTHQTLLTLPNNHLLIEFSTFAPPSNFLNTLFRLKTMGYSPILAHPERYVYYANQFEKFQEFKTKGCLLQVNVLSLMGHYGHLQKKLAHQLLDAQLVDFIGTDLHHGGHLEALSKCLKKRKIKKYIQQYKFLNFAF